MKNNFFKIFLIFIFFNTHSLSNEFKFETDKIDIIENGQIIIASGGRVISSDNKIEVEALKFNYNKKLDLLESFNGSALINSDNIKIDFEEIKIDQKKFDNIDKEKRLKFMILKVN